MGVCSSGRLEGELRGEWRELGDNSGVQNFLCKISFSVRAGVSAAVRQLLNEWSVDWCTATSNASAAEAFVVARCIAWKQKNTSLCSSTGLTPVDSLSAQPREAR